MLSPNAFFKCLSDETRFLISALLCRESELCVCELVEALDENQSKISRHLAQLRNCGILVDRRKDQWVFYSLNPALPDWARNALGECCPPVTAELKKLSQKLGKMDCRPARC